MIQKKIHQYIKQHNLIKKHSTLIVGLSGGPDSVFLFHYLASVASDMGISLIAAHMDHGWRAESAQEALFCHAIAKKINIPFVAGHFSDFSPQKTSGSKEADARAARRQFFAHVAKAHNADAIALAHHRQDQQETFFIRLLRGASLTGLTSMKPRDGMYIRPLLEADKADILHWLDEQNVSYLTDPTNVSDAYLRNRIRNHVIPALKSADNRFETTFTKSLARLQNTEDFLAVETEKVFKAVSRSINDTCEINTTQLQTQHPVMQHRLLMHWLCTAHVSFPVSQGFLDEMIKFLSHDRGGSHTIHPHWIIQKKQNWARIMPTQSSHAYLLSFALTMSYTK